MCKQGTVQHTTQFPPAPPTDPSHGECDNGTVAVSCGLPGVELEFLGRREAL
ncbi:hypothetical protein C7212DRAFT_336602 [Tuber magnatum]|uniref:Uncharacterized protein n=1 Tax=Tuber magnatum TaxID=42249 RepID=A0A317SG08_9PEZI|nr:hypothetical protein C7212DRAFT_336602 [Tuber magnatum]